MPETVENRKRIENLRLQFWLKLTYIISWICLERNVLISTSFLLILNPIFLISLISAKRFCSTFVIERYPYVVEIVLILMHKRYQFLPVFEVTSRIRDSKISQNSKHIFSVSHWKSRNYPSHTVKTTEGSGR